jgi:starch synthase (maltosyl-transferring)
LRRIDFHACDNPAHVAYSKRSEDGRDVILCVVNTNHSEEHWGTVRLDLRKLGVVADGEFVVRDLLTGVGYHWRGAEQIVGLGPGRSHVFHVESGLSERVEAETKGVVA